MKKLILLAATLLCLPLISNAFPDSKDESGQLLADWIQIHLKLVRTTKGVPHVAYSRHFAYTAIASYEAVIPGEDAYRSLAGQLQDLGPLPASPSGSKFSKVASVNAAYATMLRTYYSKNSNANLIDSMEEVHVKSLRGSGVSEQEITSSANFGKAVAHHIIEWSAGDGTDMMHAQFVSSKEEGAWIPTPPNFAPAAVPFWKDNRRMCPGDAAQMFSVLPPKYSTLPGSAFYRMVKEVYDVSTELTEEQKAIAWFWDDSPNGKYMSVPGHWSSIAAQVISDLNLPLMKSIEAYLRMHIAIYDACIVAWYGKYTYHVIRPVSYIQKNIDQTWSSLIETPSHPEFPAAHATLSSAAATALTSVLGKITLTDDTYADLGMQGRSFASFDEAAREAGLSRLYGGIHYRFSIDAGLDVGRKVAEKTLNQIHLDK